MSSKTALLLLNIGSPDSDGIVDVANYLSKFLGDRRIISLPWFLRKLLVNGVIVPCRCFRSASRYKRLAALFGGYFPLPYYGERVKTMLRDVLGDEIVVFLGMRYGKPSIEEQIKSIANGKYTRLLLLPMFPQYASSSSGSVLECALNVLKSCSIVPSFRIIPPFYDHPLFIKAFAEKLRQSGYERYERILFTYHSLPVSHVRAVAGSAYDYESVCRKTSELIALELGLPGTIYETVFQSQLSSGWLGPFIEEVVVDNAKSGVKKLLVVAPSFVADCLESSLELGEEVRDRFLSHGGEQYALVESLNDSPLWIDCLKNLASANNKFSF